MSRDEHSDLSAAGPEVLRMMTLLGNDQFNTTVLRLPRPIARHRGHADGGADARGAEPGSSRGQ
jgi:hypothetical protein